jgi:hypothetical protein
VRLIRGQKNHLPALQAMWLAGNADFRFAFEHMHERINRNRVFTQSLSFVDAKMVTLPVGILKISRATTESFW